MQVKISAGLLHVEEYGKKDGYPILFIHGNQESLDLFKEYIEDLKEYRLIMVDSRNHGMSFSHDFSYRLMADDMIELLSFLNIKKCHIIGFSDGAIIGLMLSYRTKLVNKLFAIGPNISVKGLKDEAIKYIEEDYKKTFSLFDKLMLSEPNISLEEIEKITNRVIIVGGDNDLIKDEHFTLINEHIRNSTKYILKDSGHFIVTEKKKDLIEIILNELSLDVLYEDNQVIVVDKMAGILSQEDISKDADILNIVKNYLKIKYQKTGNVYVGLIQRLDRNVSGLMVFAKTSKAASRLNIDQPKKEYLAVANGIIKKDGNLINYLQKNERDLISYQDKNGKRADLSYKVLKTSKNYSLLSIKIEQGRFHQIRSQMSLFKHPLFNDLKYGAKKEMKEPYLGLDAYKLSFIHPITKEVLTFERFPNRIPFSYYE